MGADLVELEEGPVELLLVEPAVLGVVVLLFEDDWEGVEEGMKG